MGKKLIAACMALGTLAAVLTTSASALTITEPTGASASVHASPIKSCGEESTGCLKATNIGNFQLFTSIGTMECNKDVLTGILTNNNAATVKSTIQSVSFNGTATGELCTGPFGATQVTTNVGNGVPWCVEAKAGELMEVEIRGNGCASETRSITFVLDAGSLTCRYSRAASIRGTYTTDADASDAVIHIPRSVIGSNLSREEVSSFGCPGSVEIEVDFTLETDGAIAQPVWIS
jgi:hypothetical protein